MTTTRRLVVLVCTALACPVPAHAQSDNREKAKTYFLAGKTDYEAGRFAEAAREFRQAFDLTDEPELLYNLGQAWMRGGDAGRAVEAYEGYLRRVANPKDRATVEATIRNLRKQIGSVRVVHVPAGSVVEIDGALVVKAPFDETQPILATIGRREVTVREKDGHVIHREVVIDPETVPTVDIAVEPSVGSPTSTQTQTPTPTQTQTPTQTATPTENPRLTKIGIGVAIGGVALAVGGAVTLALAHSAAGDAANAASEGAWRSSADSANTLQPAGIALVAVGAAAAVGGAVTWYLGRGKVRVALVPTPNGFAVAGVLP